MRLAINSTIIFKPLLLPFLMLFAIGLNAQINSYPFLEDFESGAAGWTVVQGPNTFQGLNTTWELGEPTLFFTPTSGVNAWVTNLDGITQSGEFGWVQSPVFDLTGLATPYLQFNIYVNTPANDLAYVIISTDGGVNWQTLGSFNDEVNWYDCNYSTPSWCDMSDWQTAAYSLDSFIDETNVVFGIVFKDETPGSSLSGFAFDDFRIADTYCFAGDEEDYFNDDPDSNWLQCIENGENIQLNTAVDNFLLSTGRTPNFTTRRWQFLSGPFGPRGPKVINLSADDEDDDDADFPNTGSGLGELFTFNYIVDSGTCEDSVEINICMNPDLNGSIEEEVIYICPGESVTSFDEMFNVFVMDQIRDLDGFWSDAYYYGIDFPITTTSFYTYFDSTANELDLMIDEIGCSSESIDISFANAQNTNDGTYDYYEVDIMINTTDMGSSFKLGDGKVFIRYNDAAFGKYVDAYEQIEVTAPDGYILGQGTDSDANAKIYTNPQVFDNINDADISRFSIRFKQDYSTNTFSDDNVTNTLEKLCHIKIRYSDINENPSLEFESGGIYDNKFTTATVCGLLNGGSEITNCLPELRTLIINDSFNSTGATLSSESINNIQRYSLYPNPSNGIVNISGDINQLDQIQIYSLTGALVNRVDSDLDRIDISDLPSGVYFFKLMSANISKTFKVINQ
ncbi:T9SS type A sorting domain-containing protein [Winogradskyella tangerina]|uniref:T9SS type A sorting domain-containing protein n=1 Tax=Winogradskyella tangerina TaxID=2023240 RepID=UPI000DBE8584|nr:T9SS type A sorting domain-containing protein [Winogradskyella tangerina]